MTPTPPRGTVRIPDHSTSEQAARKVNRVTIRSRVLAFAEGMPNAFIDEQVRALDPASPESSWRKRRSELADEGYILNTGVTRPNSFGDQCIVWIHRKFHPAPPPIKVKAVGVVAQALQRREQEALMFNALVAAAPHFQGGHSAVGKAIAEALNIPFPITYANIPAYRPI